MCEVAVAKTLAVHGGARVNLAIVFDALEMHGGSYTVRVLALETSLWKLSAGFEPSFLVDIGNWLAGQGPSVSNTAGAAGEAIFACAARAASPYTYIGM